MWNSNYEQEKTFISSPHLEENILDKTLHGNIWMSARRSDIT